jgi:hypothetical protein
MHDPQTRECARKLYGQRGGAWAAEQTGVPVQTVRRWAREGRWAQRLSVVSAHNDPKNQHPSSRAMVLAWQTRRRNEADLAGQAAAMVREALEQATRSGRKFPLRDLALAYAVLVDKAELLIARTGGADAPPIPAETRLARLRELAGVLEQRAGA